MPADEVLLRKLASSRFKLNKVYRRKEIVGNCHKFIETGDTAAALVKAHAEPFCDVVFEFAKVSGAKFRCFGVGRADRFNQIDAMKN